ncbi:hypothetical protein [Xanthobacter autotrophicus]|uniref:hypothetical protein n=1 Tax=Xanthobacter autotrophicus TaxID=280 RepID=UPI00372A10A8
MTTNDNTIKSRIAELERLIQAENEFIHRYDADFDSDRYTSAIIRKNRMEQELFTIRPRTSDDALAALQVIKHDYLEGRVTETLGWGEAGVLNLLDGVAEFIRQQAR